MADKTKTGHYPKRNQVLKILDILNDGVYVINRDYEVEYANPAFIREFGPVGTKKCYEYLCEGSRPCPECRVEEVLAGKTIRSEWHSAKTGRIYDAIDAPLIHPDGSISKLKIIHDITESKLTQQQARDLSRFPEENPFPVLRINSDGVILYSNGPGRILLDEWHSDVGQKAPATWRNLVAHTLESQRYHVEEIRCGEKIFSFAVAPVADGGYVNLYGRDVTAGRQAEEALEKSEREKSMILENANEIIAYHDVNNNLIWANKAYLDSTELPLSQLKGKKCYTCWGPGKPCLDCPVIKAIETGQPQFGELTPQNQPHWPATQGSWLVRAAPVKDNDGKIIGVIEIAIDITERKQAEEKLKESNEELSRFNRMAVGRELRMIELKKEINELCAQAGVPARYAMDPQEEVPLTDAKKHNTGDV